MFLTTEIILITDLGSNWNFSKIFRFKGEEIII